MSGALNRTFTREENGPKENLNRTFTKDDEEVDRTKTLVISKNKIRPNLPEAMQGGDENDPTQQQNLKQSRERHHVRRGTVTVNENPIGSEVAQLLNDVSDSNPEDIFVAVQRKMTQYLTEKEKHWKEEAAKNQRRVNAMYEMKLKAQAVAASTPSARTPLSGPGRSLSPDQPIEQIIQERDQYRDQAMAHVKTLGEIIKQQEAFMQKEKYYQECVSHFREEQQNAAETIQHLHERFRELQLEAEHNIKLANDEIARLKKEHDDDTVTLRYKYRQQEMKIKSLETQVQSLTAERQELLDMCDDLVARSERANDKTATIAADY